MHTTTSPQSALSQQTESDQHPIELNQPNKANQESSISPYQIIRTKSNQIDRIEFNVQISAASSEGSIINEIKSETDATEKETNLHDLV